MSLCECGCGLEVNPGRRFIHGHNGRNFSDKTRKKISAALTGIKRSDETKKKISDAKLGHEVSDEAWKNMSESALARYQDPNERKKLSDAHMGQVSGMKGKSPSGETRKRMSDSHLNSEAMQIEHGRQRGGDDIVNHHYLYDHSDLSKNTIEMARSEHTRLHRLLQKLGYIIPHINEAI